jgi:hypothetical protein
MSDIFFISSHDPNPFMDTTDDLQRQQPPTDENSGHPKNETDGLSVLAAKQQAHRLAAKLFCRRAVALAVMSGAKYFDGYYRELENT